MDEFTNLSQAYTDVRDWALEQAVPEDVGEWHAMKVDAKKNAMLMAQECYNVCWQAPMPDTATTLSILLPYANLEWAEDQFQERVSGQPLNPPPSFEKWPHQSQMDKHRKCATCGEPASEHDGIGEACQSFTEMPYSHSYPERYWSRILPDGSERRGIRFRYGDLDDVVNLLAERPRTRQAYFNMWHAEDMAAAVMGERVPCSLGYHFMMRENKLNMTYMIRSCDLVRHYCDDVYMSVRLAQWMLHQLQGTPTSYSAYQTNEWENVELGTFTFHAMNLHFFEGDRKKLQRQIAREGGVRP